MRRRQRSISVKTSKDSGRDSAARDGVFANYWAGILYNTYIL
jgi:hypothetical protein